jgi:hypothetical protein
MNPRRDKKDLFLKNKIQWSHDPLPHTPTRAVTGAFAARQGANARKDNVTAVVFRL